MRGIGWKQAEPVSAVSETTVVVRAAGFPAYRRFVLAAGGRVRVSAPCSEPDGSDAYSVTVTWPQVQR